MATNIVVQVYAIDQMIEALLGQLGPEKTEERAKAISERKEEEAKFLATATPKEKGRMRGGGRGGGAVARGGGRARGPRGFDQGHVDQAAVGGGGNRGRGRVGEVLNRNGGAHFPGPGGGAHVQGQNGRGRGAAGGGRGARMVLAARNNPGVNGRTNESAQNDIARFFPGNQATRNNAYAAAMARASANEGAAGGSGMGAAMARVWARRQEGRAGAGGQQGGGAAGSAVEQVRANSGGEQGPTGGSARLATNEGQAGAIEISSDSEVGF